MADIKKIVLPDNTEYDINIVGGSGNPVENDLYFSYNGTKVGRIHLTDSGMGFNAIDSNNNDTAGMYCRYSDGQLYLYANGSDINICPNGANSSTGQAWLDADGYFHGGHPMINTNISSSVTIPASTVTAVGNAKVTKSGIYLIFITGDFNPNVTGTGMVRFGLGYTSATSRSTIQSVNMSGGSHVYLMTSASATLAANDYIYYNIEAPVAGKFTGSIRAFLIN